jgi:hypothetical protein
MIFEKVDGVALGMKVISNANTPKYFPLCYSFDVFVHFSEGKSFRSYLR